MARINLCQRHYFEECGVGFFGLGRNGQHKFRQPKVKYLPNTPYVSCVAQGCYGLARYALYNTKERRERLLLSKDGLPIWNRGAKLAERTIQDIEDMAQNLNMNLGNSGLRGRSE